MKKLTSLVIATIIVGIIVFSLMLSSCKTTGYGCHGRSKSITGY
jgi:hypothetical protein